MEPSDRPTGAKVLGQRSNPRGERLLALQAERNLGITFLPSRPSGMHSMGGTN